MNRQTRILYNRLITIQAKIEEVRSEDPTELQSFLESASAQIQYAMEEIRKSEKK